MLVILAISGNLRCRCTMAGQATIWAFFFYTPQDIGKASPTTNFAFQTTLTITSKAQNLQTALAPKRFFSLVPERSDKKLSGPYRFVLHIIISPNAHLSRICAGRAPSHPYIIMPPRSPSKWNTYCRIYYTIEFDLFEHCVLVSSWYGPIIISHVAELFTKRLISQKETN